MGHFFVFFFKQKTAYEMRISDWSSDVCSSDLLSELLARLQTDLPELSLPNISETPQPANAAGAACRSEPPSAPQARGYPRCKPRGSMPTGKGAGSASGPPAGSPFSSCRSKCQATGSTCCRSEENTTKLQSTMRISSE